MNHTSLGVVTDFLCEGFSQASQSENVSIWTRKTNEKHDPPTWDESKSLLPAPVDTQEPGCRGQQWPQLCSSGSQPGSQGLRALTLTLDSAPNPKVPHPSVWRGQRWKLDWFTVGLSKWEARLIFPYITIIKNNHCCHWIFMLTTPGPDICIKLSCRTLGKDFSTAAKLCKNQEMSNSCCSHENITGMKTFQM